MLFNYNENYYSETYKQNETQLNDKGQSGLVQAFIHWAIDRWKEKHYTEHGSALPGFFI